MSNTISLNVNKLSALSGPTDDFSLATPNFISEHGEEEGGYLNE